MSDFVFGNTSLKRYEMWRWNNSKTLPNSLLFQSCVKDKLPFFPPLVALITTEMVNCVEKTKRLSILSVGFLVIIITIFNWGYCPNLIKYCWRCSLGDQLWGRHVLQWSGGSQWAGVFLHQGKNSQIFSMYHHKNFHIWNPGCWCFKYLPDCSIAQKQKSVSKYHSGF